MGALLISTVFSAAFGLIVRHALDRRCNPWAVGVVNYVVATLFQLARYLLAPTPLDRLSIGLGLLVGFLYAANLALLIPALMMRGVSVASSMSRLAVILPIAASLLIWGERLTPLEILGTALSLAALPLLTVTPTSAGQAAARPARQGAWLLLALLLGNGLSMVLTKTYRESASTASDALFLAALFGGASIVSSAVWMFHRERTGLRDLPHGLALGLTNALCNTALVAALAVLPGVLVFPVYSAAGLVFTALMARVLFAERTTRLETAGIAVAIVAVALANLG